MSEQRRRERAKEFEPPVEVVTAASEVGPSKKTGNERTCVCVCVCVRVRACVCVCVCV